MSSKKVRKVKKVRIKKCRKRIKQILPVIVFLQDYNRFSPDEVLEIMSLLFDINNINLLDDVKKSELRSYLSKWGYSNEWVK